jgi:peroxiredoxin
MQERYADQGLVVVAINLDKDKKFVEKFLQTYPAKFTIAYDPKGETASSYKVAGMPSSYLIDPQGELKYSHIGFRETSKSEIEQQIITLLKVR